MCRDANGSYIPASDYFSEAKRRDEHLLTLKSVSRAYRCSAVRELKLKAKENADVSRNNAQAAARGPGQALATFNAGAQSGQGGGAGYYLQGVNVAPGGFTLISGYPGQQLVQAYANQQAMMAAVVAPPLTTPSDLPVEFRAGELTAWRCWRYAKATKLLRSMSMSTTWTPGAIMDGDPDLASEGVHAWKTEQQALDYANGHASGKHLYTPGGIVVGEVELWGKVVEHDDGYRAEHASIKSLVHFGGGCGHPYELCDLYRVPRDAVNVATAPCIRTDGTFFVSYDPLSLGFCASVGAIAGLIIGVAYIFVRLIYA